MNPDEYLPQQRAALIAWHLAHGEGLRTKDVARLTGVTPGHAWRLMCALSAVLPIYQDDRQVWQICYATEADIA